MLQILLGIWVFTGTLWGGNFSNQRRVLSLLHKQMGLLNFILGVLRSQQHFATLTCKINLGKIISQRSALCMTTIWYTTRCEVNVNVCWGGMWILESTLVISHILENKVPQSPLITTKDSYKMRCFIWACCESHHFQKKIHFFDHIFSCSVPQNNNSTVLRYTVRFFALYITNT